MPFWPEISALGVFLNFDNERMPKCIPKSPPPLPNGIIINYYNNYPVRCIPFNQKWEVQLSLLTFRKVLIQNKNRKWMLITYLLTMEFLTVSRISCPKLILLKFSYQGVPAMHIHRVNGLLGNRLCKSQGCPDICELRKYQLSSYQAAAVLNLYVISVL